MPSSAAFLAIDWPTILLNSVLGAFCVLMSFCFDEAEAKVSPELSSIN